MSHNSPSGNSSRHAVATTAAWDFFRCHGLRDNEVAPLDAMGVTTLRDVASLTEGDVASIQSFTDFQVNKILRLRRTALDFVEQQEFLQRMVFAEERILKLRHMVEKKVINQDFYSDEREKTLQKYGLVSSSSRTGVVQKKQQSEEMGEQSHQFSSFQVQQAHDDPSNDNVSYFGGADFWYGDVADDAVIPPQQQQQACVASNYPTYYPSEATFSHLSSSAPEFHPGQQAARSQPDVSSIAPTSTCAVPSRRRDNCDADDDDDGNEDDVCGDWRERVIHAVQQCCSFYQELNQCGGQEHDQEEKQQEEKKIASLLKRLTSVCAEIATAESLSPFFQQFGAESVRDLLVAVGQQVVALVQARNRASKFQRPPEQAAAAIQWLGKAVHVVASSRAGSSQRAALFATWSTRDLFTSLAKAAADTMNGNAIESVVRAIDNVANSGDNNRRFFWTEGIRNHAVIICGNAAATIKHTGALTCVAALANHLTTITPSSQRDGADAAICDKLNRVFGTMLMRDALINVGVVAAHLRAADAISHTAAAILNILRSISSPSSSSSLSSTPSGGSSSTLLTDFATKELREALLQMLDAATVLQDERGVRNTTGAMDVFIACSSSDGK